MLMNSIKNSFDTISNTKTDSRVEYTQISRCLDMLIKLIEDLDGINITGDKQQTGEEWTINVTNNISDSMPPKKFVMKVYANSTLRVLREQIANKINPPKKENQIKLMTRGQYPRGENMTLKELKFLNKQTFMVELNEQLLPDNENMFN